MQTQIPQSGMFTGSEVIVTDCYKEGTRGLKNDKLSVM